MIYGKQIKAARALLKMGQNDLFKLSGISVAAIQKIENVEGRDISATQETMNKLKKALEKAGVRFIKAIDESGDGAGVRLWKENIN